MFKLSNIKQVAKEYKTTKLYADGKKGYIFYDIRDEVLIEAAMNDKIIEDYMSEAHSLFFKLLYTEEYGHHYDFKNYESIITALYHQYPGCVIDMNN